MDSAMEHVHRRPAWNIANLDSARLSAGILVCLVAIVCYLAARLVFVLGIPPDHIAAFWPSTAFLVAALLLVRRRIWPVLIAAGLGAMALADFENGVPIRFEIWITLGNLGEVLVATLGISLLLKGVPHLSSLKTLAKYMVFAVILVPFGSALVGANASAPGGYMLQWRVWFFADALAFLTVAPAILNWVREGREWSRRPHNYLEFAALMTSLVLFGYLTFMGTGRGEQPALLYSLVPILLWAALRLGLKGVSTSMIVVALMSTWGAAHGRGPFSEQGPLNNALSLQLFLFFAAIPFTVLAVLVEEQKRAQEVLRESEQRFRLVANTAPVMIWMTGPDTHCTFLNQTWLDFTGRSVETEFASSWAEGIHPEDFQRSLDTYNEAFDRRQPFRVENRLRRYDGEYRWVLDVGVPRLNMDGSFAGYIGSAVDVTDLKRTEEALRKSEERFRMAAQAGKMFAYEWDAATDKIVRSEGVAQILGVDEGSLITGQRILTMVPPQDRERLIAAVAKLSPEEPSLQISYRMVRSDGTVIWVERNSRAYFDEQGRMLRMIGMVADITERKLAERELTLANERLRLAMEAVKSVGWDRDVKSGRDTLFGDLQGMFGIPSEVYDGRVEDFHRFLHPEDRRRVLQAIDDAMESKKPYVAEFRILRPDGIVRWVGARGKFYYSPEGEPERMLGMSIDITERKLADEALRESEVRLRLAVHAGKMYAFEWDVATDVIIRSEEATHIPGLSGEPIRLTKKQLSARVHPEDRATFNNVIAECTPESPDHQISFRLLRRDGSVVWFERTGHAFFDEQGRMVRMIGMVADVTERKVAEEALRQKEAELSEAQRLAQVGSWQWDPLTDTVTWSRELYRITGRDPNLPAASYKEHSLLLTAESWERLQRSVEEALHSGTPYELDLEYVRPDGSTIWARARGEAQRDTTGHIVRLRGTAQDITERRLAERELTLAHDRLRLAMEAGKLVGWDWNIKSGRDTWFGDLQNMFRMPSETYVGTVEELHRRIHPEDRVRVMEAAKDAMENKKPYAGEYRIIWPDGTVRWVAVKGKFYYSPDGEPERMLGMKVDITERKLAEEALRESEERLRLAAQVGKMYAFDWDMATDVVIRSEEASRILGLSGEAISPTKKYFLASIHPDDQAALNASVAVRTPQSPNSQICFRLLRPDGSVVWLERTGHAIFDEQGKMVRMIGMVADVTERKLVEEALRESEERLRLAAQVGKMYAFDWDMVTDVVIRSEESTHILGLTGDQTGLTLNQILASVHPEDQAIFMTSIAELTPESPITRISFRLLRPDGSVVWLERTGHAFFDEQGRILRMVGMVADVTERKLAEEALSKVGGRLIEAHEEERTWIARELHDDINQRLALLANDLELMGQDPPDSAAEIRSRISEQLKRVHELSADVQAISHRLHSSKLRYLGIVAAARSFCQELSEQYNVEIDFTHADIPHTVPEEISLCLFRVLQEALHNAVKHSGVRHFEVELRGTPDRIDLTVRDAGFGFDPEAMVNNRGLGLVSMLERVNLVKGYFSIDSRPERGTTIHVRLPLSTRGDSARAAGG
jgi:PAS domain S-box-containing protein